MILRGGPGVLVFFNLFTQAACAERREFMKVRLAGNALMLCAALLLAGACGHPISRPLRTAAQKDPALFTTVLADPASFRGKTVLWGGRVIEITNMKTGTEMIVMETPLDFFGAPQATKSWRGRFIARLPVFLDPAVYLADRDITLAGELIGGGGKRSGGNTLQISGSPDKRAVSLGKAQPAVSC